MAKLVAPHGSSQLKPLLLTGQEKEEELKEILGTADDRGIALSVSVGIAPFGDGVRLDEAMAAIEKSLRQGGLKEDNDCDVRRGIAIGLIVKLRGSTLALPGTKR